MITPQPQRRYKVEWLARWLIRFTHRAMNHGMNRYEVDAVVKYAADLWEGDRDPVLLDGSDMPTIDRYVDDGQPFAVDRCNACGYWIIAWTFEEWSRAIKGVCPRCGEENWC